MSLIANKIEKKLTYRDLAIIQAGSLSFPGMMLGSYIASNYGIEKAIGSVLTGNLIVWCISLIIISMTVNKRVDAIQNFKNYIGHIGSILIALVFVLIFLNWFSFQLNDSITCIDKFLQSTKLSQNIFKIRVGVGIGLITALLAIGGIRSIKFILISSFPIILLCYLALMTKAGKFTAPKYIGLSLNGVITIVLFSLAAVVNLPTFFRHAKSQAHSYLGISTMIGIFILFQLLSIWIHYDPSCASYMKHGQSWIILILLFTSLINVNLINIYFASSCWENIAPFLSSPKSYVIFGMIGTLFYTFVQISPPMLFFHNLLASYAFTLAFLLVLAFLFELMIQHRPRKNDKKLNLVAWLIGCIQATFALIDNPNQVTQAVYSGITSSSLFFITVLFLEESTWASCKIIHYKNKNRKKAQST